MQALAKTLKSQIKALPFLRGYFWQKGLRKRFETELQLLKGTHRNENNHPSIIHFSFDKAASQYTKSLLKQCASQHGMVTVNIQDYAFNSDFPYLHELSAEQMESYKHIFIPRGYLYSVFGGMVEGIAEMERYILLLVLRDPRDLLVSRYFSISVSHIPPYGPSEKYDMFISQRQTAQSMTIDEYVVAESDRVYEGFSRYKMQLVDKYPNLYITRYEQMVNNFPSWLDELLERSQLTITPEFRQGLLEQNQRMRPKDEDVRRHLRKGKAGDYKEKLKQETIYSLNKKLGSILDEFGYAKD